MSDWRTHLSWHELSLSEARQVFTAELRRHWAIAPRSLLMATLIFPFLTVLAIYHLPTVDLKGTVHLQHAVYSLQLPEQLESQHAEADPLTSFLEGLQQQPYYRLELVADAAARYRSGGADLALIIRGDSRRPNDAPWTVEILRKQDFISELFVDHLKSEIARIEAQTLAHVPIPLIPIKEPSVQQATQARSGLVQVAPFLLLGFAWFFLTAGTVEAFVSERERRTLELLLSAPISKSSVALGKIGFVLLQALGPQLASAAALILVGFSPWVLSLVFLIELALLPATVICFWYFRDLDNSVAAGWRTGLIFMLGFPILILTDDVVGTLSPFYYLGKVLEGPPPPTFFVGCLLLEIPAALLALTLLPKVARGWTP